MNIDQKPFKQMELLGNTFRCSQVLAVALQQLLLPLLLLFFIALMTMPVFAKSIESQRQDYLMAKKALAEQQYRVFTNIANRLKDYPLYPYLRYDYLRNRLIKVKDDAVVDFLKQYVDLPVANKLRKSWLTLLIKRGHWDTFIENYTPQTDPLLQCYQLQARLKTNNNVLLPEDTRSIWLTGKSLPPQCDPAFALLYKSDLMTNDLVWERLRLSMQNKQLGLVRFLSKRLDADHKVLAKKWLRIHDKPYQHTHKPALTDNAKSREILAYGILRLARQDVTKALKRLNALKEDYSFTATEMLQIERVLAIRAAKSKHKLAVQLLDKIDNADVNDDVFRYRLQIALASQDWGLLKKWTVGNAPVPKIALRWRYWQARALDETGEPDKARAIYRELAKERDYYGFLAADKIGEPYRMNHFPLPENQKEFARLEALPAIKRAYEFYQLNMNYLANREWHHALNKMTTYQMQIAASIAKKWGWHDRAIFTMGRAKAYDDLELRFPVLFNDLLNRYAEKHRIDLGWMYGLVRAESAFIEDVKSPAGALGLMQVMPETGKMVAKKIGLNGFKTSKLKQAKTNVPIGSAYMKQMLKKFDGNMALATAAYNAGPHRVLRWLPKQGCMIPDVWVEQIPFNETRKYVRRVLTYANIYDWRLQTRIKPIKERMAFINDKRVGNSNCVALEVSENRYVH